MLQLQSECFKMFSFNALASLMNVEEATSFTILKTKNKDSGITQNITPIRMTHFAHTKLA